MSTMLGDDWYPDYAQEQYEAELYEEHRKEALEEFTAERLHSFYLAHPDVARAALTALGDARTLERHHCGAALVFAMVAIELGIKTVLLRPVVYGLVHQEAAASLITGLATSHTAFDRFRGLLFHILSTHAGIDLKTSTRRGSRELLWKEISVVREKRNAVLHRGEQATGDDAALGIAVAGEVLEGVVPTVIHHLGLHLHDGARICSNAKCEERTSDAGVV